MQIREVRKNDYKEIVAITKSLYRWFSKNGLRQVKYAFRKQKGFVSIENHKVTGFIFYRKWKNTAVITWIGIGVNSRNKGIGKTLFRHVEKLVKKQNVKRIKISTLARTVKYKPYEETRKFWESCGFRTLRIDKNFYPFPSKDREVMIKELK